MAYEQGTNSIANGKEAEIIWHNSMIRIINTTIYKSQGNNSLKNICQKILVELDEKIEREFERLRLGTDVHVEEDQSIQCDTTNMSVLDPPRARSKGVRNTRLKGHFEKCKTKPSKDASTSRENLFIYLFLFKREKLFTCLINVTFSSVIIFL
ncbi:hypothetical protein HYC85_013710 [Camellia sinensis]|uniref:Uncharacterized protein n=1 Tax=Camellia sinensis TaxID=4442 RepID=A0A7J7H439_CAMSI|nr:hypothetical protein HYC85_013710 [Camellia sinensis]